MSELLVGWTTCGDADAAHRLARDLVESDFAACAQIDDAIHSFYKFNGDLQSDLEYRIWFKFSSGNLEAISSYFDTNHPYGTPQWVVVTAGAVSDKYLKWALEG